MGENSVPGIKVHPWGPSSLPWQTDVVQNRPLPSGNQNLFQAWGLTRFKVFLKFYFAFLLHSRFTGLADMQGCQMVYFQT
jgi:hypothetical protein